MCLKALMKLAVPVPKIMDYERYLFVGPHPDDIEIGAGATAARLAAEGKKVTFLICTDGRYGTPDLSVSTESFAQCRKEEAIAAASVLGVTDVRFLEHSDCGDYDVTELSKEIADVICDTSAECVFAPDGRLLCEMHPDHIRVGEAACRSAIVAGVAHLMNSRGHTATNIKALALYYTARPTRYVGVTKYQTLRKQAIRTHKSQFPTDTEAQRRDAKLVEFYGDFRAFRFGCRRFTKFAEGFRVYGSVHLHCAPEAADF